MLPPCCSGPSSPSPKRVTLRTLREKYMRGEPISMVTAYDYPSAVHVRTCPSCCFLLLLSFSDLCRLCCCCFCHRCCRCRCRCCPAARCPRMLLPLLPLLPLLLLLLLLRCPCMLLLLVRRCCRCRLACCCVACCRLTSVQCSAPNFKRNRRLAGGRGGHRHAAGGRFRGHGGARPRHHAAGEAQALVQVAHMQVARMSHYQEWMARLA